jgi:hypothetical protein
MRGTDAVADRVSAARNALGRMRNSLLNPTPARLEECAEPLNEAVEALRELAASARRGGAEHELREAAIGLERDLAEVGALLEQAGAFYLGSARILHSAAGSYEATGEMRAPDGTTVSYRC